MATDGERIRVLVVEDEESYRQALVSGLGREGFEVEVCSDGAQALHSFTERPPDIVLLDILLPGMRGIEVCRRMRELSPVPIVMVSAVDAELDVVLGFELGASGYVTKPFRLRELVARMHAILRRVSPPDDPSVDSASTDLGPGSEAPDPATGSLTTFGSVTVDFVRREVTVAGTRTHLSRREFELLAVLLSPPRWVRTRDELIDLLWLDRSLSDSRTLDTHIHRLRAKLEPDPAEPRYIVTVRGVGFRIDPDGAPGPPPIPRPEADAALEPNDRSRTAT